jgi:hypothetical protein
MLTTSRLIASIRNFWTNQHLFFTFSLFPVGWMAAEEAPVVIGRQLVSHWPLGDQQVEIVSQLVTTMSVFLRKKNWQGFRESNLREHQRPVKERVKFWKVQYLDQFNHTIFRQIYSRETVPLMKL